jgi:hypothetical protein
VRLHAGVVVRAGERERLERQCRYTLRPPLALLERLTPYGPIRQPAAFIHAVDEREGVA